MKYLIRIIYAVVKEWFIFPGKKYNLLGILVEDKNNYKRHSDTPEKNLNHVRRQSRS